MGSPTILFLDAEEHAENHLLAIDCAIVQLQYENVFQIHARDLTLLQWLDQYLENDDCAANIDVVVIGHNCGMGLLLARVLSHHDMRTHAQLIVVHNQGTALSDTERVQYQEYGVTDICRRSQMLEKLVALCA